MRGLGEFPRCQTCSPLRAALAGLAHDRRKMLSQQIERELGVDAEVLREQLDLIASQRRLDLFGGNREIGAVGEPGLDLRA